MQTGLVNMIKKHLSTKQFLIVCTTFALIISISLFFINIQTAQGEKKKEDKVKEKLKATVNLNIKWNINDTQKTNQGSLNLKAKGLLTLNREMSAMDQGLPAVMVNYKNKNMMAHYSYKETISIKDPPDDCPNSVIERYNGSGNTMVALVPGPGNLIMNHFSSLFKDTGLGDMASAAVAGMLVDHYLFTVPCNEVMVNGQKLNRSNCKSKPSTRKLKITANITGKIMQDGKMEGRKTWVAKADTTSGYPRVNVKVNELPATMNNKKPFSPKKASNGDVTYTLSWKIEKIEPHVLIYRLRGNDWHDITDGTSDEEEQEIFPGEKLTLKAVVVMPGETKEPPKGKWEISEKDKILKDWQASTEKSEKVKVGKTDKKEIEFFWWKKVKKAEVKYKVAGKNLTGKTEFKLIMPKVNVVEEPGKEWAFGHKKGCEIVPDMPSMKVSSTVSTEKNKPFCLQYVQLVKSNNFSLQWECPTSYCEEWEKVYFWYKDINEFMLDTAYPYSNKESCLAEAGPVVFGMQDTPGQDASQYKAILDIDQNFQLYLMFRPGNKGAGNAWVPLRRINWGWKIRAINYDNPDGPGRKPCGFSRFNVSDPAAKLPIGYPYRSKKAEDYPEWAGVAKEKKEMDPTGVRVEKDEYNKNNKPPK